jgi:regulatory protein
MRITALEPQVNNPERVNLFVDGRFLLGVSAALVLQMGVYVEQEITAEQLDSLNQAEVEQQAVDRALNFLSYRPRSRAEVRRYLLRKETPSEIVESALARLDRLDFVNDRAFAGFWIENREQFSPRGSRALKNELRLKGVDREVVDELVDEEQDEARALLAGRKKAFSLLHQTAMDYATFRNRLGSFLQRRGFGYDVVARTVKALWREMQADGGEDEE